MNNQSPSRSLSIEKLLAAPIALVWEAWVNPEFIASWWGPEGFTNTMDKMELVAGGEWRFVMHGPDGKRYPNKSIFVELVPLEKFVFQHFNPNYIASITFKPKGNDTFMEWTVVFETIELFETVVKVFKADEGLHQNVAKLEQFLEQRLTNK